MRDRLRQKVLQRRREVGRAFNLREKFRCRFAADSEIGNHQCNLRLGLCARALSMSRFSLECYVSP
jgi:hypothetical protein